MKANASLAVVVLSLLLLSVACGTAPDRGTESAGRTLAELAAAPAPELIETPAPERARSVYRALVDAVDAGEIDALSADRILMPMLWGDASAVPAEYHAEGASLAVPDMALFWMLQRMQAYPPEARAELEAWLPRNRGRAAADSRVAGVPSRLGLVTPLRSGTLAPVVATSVAGGAPPQQMCEPGSQGELPQLALGEVPGPDGFNVQVAVCGAEGLPADNVMNMALADLPAMMQFAKPLSSGNLFPQRRSQLLPPQIQIFLVSGQLQTPTGDAVSHGYMAKCSDVVISIDGKQQCEIEATVRHELFHCLHMRALGYDTATVPEGHDPDAPLPSSIAGKVPDWISEGSAVWAEQRFGPEVNAEWEFFQRLANAPTRTVELLDYPAGLFLEYLWQQRGNDEIIRQMLQTFVAGAGAPTGGSGIPGADKMESLLAWPETWYRFSDAIAGFEPLYDGDWGSSKLTDTPAFPYEESADCSGDTIALGQEMIAPRTTLASGQLALIDVNVQALATQYDIVQVNVGSGIDYIDVGLAGDLADYVEAHEQVKITAIAKAANGEEPWDWSELWRQRTQHEPMKLGTNSMQFDQTEGSFRVCLTDDTPECDEVPDDEIFRGIERITLIVSNAGTAGEIDDLTGGIALLPGGMPGWGAERVEIRDPAPDAGSPDGGQTAGGHDVTGRLRLRADPNDPEITFVSDWVWFPREQYPWDSLGSQDQSRPQINPSILTGYVNYGCHFEGWVRWRYQELEVEVLPNDWVRRRLKLTRDDQGGFYNNDLKFKCELVTKNPRINELMGTLVTMGQAPAAGLQSSLVQLAYMRVLDQINTLHATPGSFGELLYQTFKAIMTANAMDDNVYEADFYFSPDGSTLEFGILDGRTVVFRH